MVARYQLHRAKVWPFWLDRRPIRIYWFAPLVSSPTLCKMMDHSAANQIKTVEKKTAIYFTTRTFPGTKMPNSVGLLNFKWNFIKKIHWTFRWCHFIPVRSVIATTFRLSHLNFIPFKAREICKFWSRWTGLAVQLFSIFLNKNLKLS